MITPIKDFESLELILNRGAIIKCDSTSRVQVGLLWQGAKDPVNWVFEQLTGTIKNTEDPELIVKISRETTVGTYVAGNTALKCWNRFFETRNPTSGRKLWIKNWDLIHVDT